MTLTIGTHNGHFHADEALAVFMLRQLSEYKDANLVRSRNAEELSKCDIVVDVGDVYDAAKFRFDHHQREFATKFPGRSTTRLSSAGLVYLHFGKRLIAQQSGLDQTSKEVDLLFEHLYDGFIEAFDANDNGVSAYDQSALTAANVSARFRDGGFSIAAAVGRLNYVGSLGELILPGFVPSKVPGDQKQEDALFECASKLCGTQFLLAVQSAVDAWLPARETVRTAFKNRKSIHSSGQIIEFPHVEIGLVWAEHLYTVEKDEQEGNVLYAIFPENGKADSRWRVRAIGVEGRDFVNRQDLPSKWKGMRDGDLAALSGVEGAVFVHASGFIGGATTRAGVLKMAALAVEGV